MKKTLLTILALLCIVGSLAKGKDVVWEKPNAICNIFRTGTRFKVNRMELEETPIPCAEDNSSQQCRQSCRRKAK